ncbi:MAG TPA: hypothetical protein VGY55_09980, partial [Pirellulales bacterium]|nr:hypothetical protein [Pirellulales bacterium]
LSSFNGSSSSNAVLGGATLQVGLDGLTVGNSGPGQLTIDGGGTVNVLGPINIGTSANDPGKVVVGNGSLTTTSSQSITVGGGGLSSLVLNAGANVSAGFLTINGIGSVRAGGSTNSPAFLSVAQAIVVGPTGSLAALNLSSGASVSTATLAIGPQGGVDLTGGGTASIGTVIIPPAAGSMSIGFGGMVKDNGSIQGQVTLLGGRLGGSGKVNGKFINGGFVAPGDPQTLTIVGDYQQTGSGELELQIAGAGSGEYDQLDITGNIELDSGAQLNLDFINGFAPTTGDTFDILSDSNLTSADSFSQINVGGLEPGWEYAIEQQNGNEVIKSLNNGVAVPEPSTAAMGIFLFVAMTILHWIRRIVVPVSAVQWPPAEMHAPSA